MGRGCRGWCAGASPAFPRAGHVGNTAEGADSGSAGVAGDSVNGAGTVDMVYPTQTRAVVPNSSRNPRAWSPKIAVFFSADQVSW